MKNKMMNLSPELAAAAKAQDADNSSVGIDSIIYMEEGEVNLSGDANLESEFVRIPKNEYEAIKSRMSAIESRISQEFGSVEGSALSVQCAYEQALVKSERLEDNSSPATNQLARRLGRELKIRRSLDNNDRVIRSPSARKIGTLRRRSRERSSVTRNASWHVAPRPALAGDQFYHRSNLKRGRPNTVFSGLPQPNPLIAVGSPSIHSRIRLEFHHEQLSLDAPDNLHSCPATPACLQNNSPCRTTTTTPQLTPHNSSLGWIGDGPLTRSQARRASSFHGTELPDVEYDIKKFNSLSNIAQTQAPYIAVADTVTEPEVQKNGNDWQNAEGYFLGLESPQQQVPITGRASIAKLRSQNAGMVLARMKLFDCRGNQKTPLLINSGSCRNATKKQTASPRLNHVSETFVRNGQATQSLRPRKPSEEKQSGTRTTRVQEIKATKTPQGSPKKMGTPRKKYQNSQSPNGSQRKQKLKLMKSPVLRTEVLVTDTPIMQRGLKKHSSLRGMLQSREFDNLLWTNVPPLARKNLKKNNSLRNIQTPPVKWLGSGKENVKSPNGLLSQRAIVEDLVQEKYLKISPQVHLPDNLKETIYDICTPTLDKLYKSSMSPLKERMGVNSQLSAPSILRHKTPYIKRALVIRSPSQFGKTPQTAERLLHSQRTPMKALPGFCSLETALGTPRRQSPRNLQFKSRKLS